jgi:hypothetical protein
MKMKLFLVISMIISAHSAHAMDKLVEKLLPMRDEAALAEEQAKVEAKFATHGGIVTIERINDGPIFEAYSAKLVDGSTITTSVGLAGDSKGSYSCARFVTYMARSISKRGVVSTRPSSRVFVMSRQKLFFDAIKQRFEAQEAAKAK